ncbi:hypothetical protein BpHYR1_018876, partial [Brachionus plicatilis]
TLETARDVQNFLILMYRIFLDWSDKNPPSGYRQIAADLNSKFKNHKTSKETVRKVLAKEGIESYSTVKKPLLTVSDRTKPYKKYRKVEAQWVYGDACLTKELIVAQFTPGE